MTSLVTLRHRTIYRFQPPVTLGPHTIRLHPAPTSRANLRSYALALDPAPATLHCFNDLLANRLTRAAFSNETDHLTLDVTLALELTDYNPFDFVLDAAVADWPFAYPAALAPELAPYARPPSMVPWLAATFAGLELGPQSSTALLVALNQRVRALIGYVTRLEPGIQDPAVTIERASGSCRDVAWLMVQAARALGFAARFSSGYLIQLVDKLAPTPGLVDDTADLHAWAEIYLPGAGWLGFDATSGLICGRGHIPLVSAAHPAATAPVEGTTGTTLSHLETSISITRE